MRPLAALLLLVLPLSLGAAEQPALADQVAEAAGCDAFAKLAHLRFTWRFVAKDLARSFDWDIAKRSVAVTMGGATTVVPQDGPKAKDGPEVDAHKAFVNDSYWALFCLHLHWDDAAISDLGEVEVPQFPDLGKRHALKVAYPASGAGYTPGDAYVLYLGDDHLPVAWAFHKAGAEAPTLVVKWLDWTTVKGVHLPTRFVTADGKDFITISAVSAD